MTALFAVTAMVQAVAGEFPQPVGLQLESFNGGMHDNRSNTLDKVYRLGFKVVELVGDYGQSPDKGIPLSVQFLRTVAW